MTLDPASILGRCRLFQYYLRDEGLALSWVGTGRCLFSLDFEAADFQRVQTALLNAARRMSDDGWWWGASPKMIQWKIAMELLKGVLPSFLVPRGNAKAA
jgi:glutamate-1-semialdehyde 2,1-aminomutase